ncbi:hypothetical protein EVAR_61609_1 [Eumeta japonica]|uniref:Uncharacterized protein n=1 Tax=Eumeta variegata TaxID=151549 RepID=A0A4C1SDV7_EUMVA|nr:hypothetical protein EVAR_61609_1 [Eumeta japonica]
MHRVKERVRETLTCSRTEVEIGKYTTKIIEQRACDTRSGGGPTARQWAGTGGPRPPCARTNDASRLHRLAVI